jgi:hypothetical protein
MRETSSKPMDNHALTAAIPGTEGVTARFSDDPRSCLTAVNQDVRLRITRERLQERSELALTTDERDQEEE